MEQFLVLSKVSKEGVEIMPFGYYYFDYTYLVLIPAFIFALYAQFKVNSTYNKYSKVQNARGLTGADVARRILDANGLWDVKIVHIAGNLTDNFNPQTKTVSLSDSTYSSTSVAAIGVAAHECGHAVQHAVGYTPIKIRSAIIPVTNIGSSLGVILLLVGLIFSSYYLSMFGILLYSLVAVFQAVTLPVEFNASARALRTLREDFILEDDELPLARKVLTAAALTYVAALLSSLATIMRYLLLANNRRRR